MPLPRMTSPDPRTVPASEERTLPDLYMTHLRMASLSDGDKRAMVTLCRYNYDTGELSPDPEDCMTHVIESVAAEAARRLTSSWTKPTRSVRRWPRLSVARWPKRRVPGCSVQGRLPVKARAATRCASSAARTFRSVSGWC